jgi:exodeoxyribonuclease VIII
LKHEGLKMAKPEIVEGMSYRDYDARPGLRAGYLAALDAGTPGKAEWERAHQTDTPAMKLGRAIHCMILEPEKFAAEYTISAGPVNPRTGNPYGSETKAYLEWEAQQTKPIISRDEHARMLGMAEAIAAHPAARQIRNTPRQCELSVFWEQDGIPCKARCDCVQAESNILWDLKSTSGAGYRDFERSVANYRYHLQAAWFINGLSRAGVIDGPAVKFLWLAVESSAPYALAVYQCAGDLLNDGHLACEAAFETYKRCLTEKVFKTAYADEIILMQTPRWMLPDDNALEG